MRNFYFTFSLQNNFYYRDINAAFKQQQQITNDKMTTIVGNTLKNKLRKHIKQNVLKAIPARSRERQSKSITQKVLQSQEFRSASRISIYLSTATEVDTSYLLSEMFHLGKEVFVPTYKGKAMKMVLLRDWNDYESLPLTKWHIKQPRFEEDRESALEKGIDLFLVPGVAFTLSGGRLGHGMGYYDKYLKHYMTTFPNRDLYLMALAFKDQIVPEDALPLEEHDVRLDCIVTE